MYEQEKEQGRYQPLAANFPGFIGVERKGGSEQAPAEKDKKRPGEKKAFSEGKSVFVCLIGEPGKGKKKRCGFQNNAMWQVAEITEAWIKSERCDEANEQQEEKGRFFKIGHVGRSQTRTKMAAICRHFCSMLD